MAAEYATSPKVGHGTEYTENYTWDQRRAATSTQSKNAPGLLTSAPRTPLVSTGASGLMHSVPPSTEFRSQFYPSVYRETTIRRDEKGHYIDPFKNIATKPYGRRLMYDDTHPDKMYASQWSSELADIPGPYSFPTTTGLDPEIPWTKDMQWKIIASKNTKKLISIGQKIPGPLNREKFTIYKEEPVATIVTNGG